MKKKGKLGRILLVLLLILVLTGAAYAISVFFFGDEAAASEVVLEPIGSARDAAFTDSVAPEPGGSLLDYAAQTDAAGTDATTELAGYRSPDGSVPGVYGGSLNQAACDPDLLEGFLGADAERAEAWAGVIQISASDIPAYLATLTPVNLAADTRVVNHGFDAGEAIPRGSVLQRGSAVMIDNQGVPRVDCYSGGPLVEPEPIEDESFSGEGWTSLERSNIIVIVRAPSSQESFELREIETGELFTRPAGSRGESDSTGTVDLGSDGPIEFNTDYQDALVEGRSDARYLLDAPDGAIMTFRVANRRDSERAIRGQIFSGGTTYASFRVNPGDAHEEVVILDHQGGAEFEFLFDEGPGAFDYTVDLEVQQDAGQSGDAGDDFATGFEISAGTPVQGLIGGDDRTDVYLVEILPGSEMTFDMDVSRESAAAARVNIFLDGDRLFGDRASPGGSTSYSQLFSGEDGGTLEVIVDEGGADYRFVIDFTAQADGGQAGDAGDSLADAREIPTATSLEGQVGGPDPADWYLFEAPSDSVTLEVANDVSSTGGAVRFTVQDASGSNVLTGRVSAGSTESVAFEPEAGEGYRLIFDEGPSRYAFQIR